MVQRTGGPRRKTRHKLSKPLRTKGKMSIRNYFQAFKEGDRVLLKAEPAIQKGMYLPRFHGKICVVKNKKGTCYELAIKDGNKQKLLIVHPIHLRKA
ncbi:MAG: 50S ribosomal protein L21e [archaeon]